MKKFLSLVLALAMTMSLVTVSAGAKDFADADSIQYAEAVDVMTAIGVVDGDTAGNFNPTAGLTRGAAAKIICNLILGPTTAAELNADTNPYVDVNKSSTFAGYIAYCKNAGIISGYADGTFKPAAPLTGYAFMKMLLGALGYDSAIEGYTGANWSINVAKQAISIGLNNGLKGDFNGSNYVTREEAMLYAFNMLQADLVEYDTQIIVNNGTLGTSTGTAKAVTAVNSSAKDGNIDRDGYIQFAELYFNKLVKTGGDEAFLRPSTTWYWKGVEVGTYASDADKVYYGDVKLGEIYKDLGLTAKADVDVNINGSYNVSGKIEKNDNDKLTSMSTALDNTIGNGTNVEVYLDSDTNDVTICVISVYAAKVTAEKAATSKNDAYVVVGFGQNAAGTAISFDDDEFDTEAFEEDDVVAITYSEKTNAIETMVKLESVAGALTRYTDTKSMTLDGTTYKYAKEYAFDGITESSLTNKSDYVVYTDANGYALWIEESAFAIENYALLMNISSTAGTWGGDNVAKLLFTDGTVKTVDLDKNYVNAGTPFATLNTHPDVDNYFIVAFTVKDNGDYKLSVPTAENNKDMYIKDHVVNGFASTTQFDSKTVFVVNTDDDDYKVYTGIKNTPTISDTAKSDGFAYSRDNVAKVVFSVGGTVTNTSKDITFIAGASASKIVKQNDTADYYLYNAVVAGEITTVRLEAGKTFNGKAAGQSDYNLIFNVIKADTDDILTTGTAWVDGSVTSDSAVGIKKVSTDEVKIGGAILSVDKNVNVYYVDEDGNITELADVMAVVSDSNDTVLYTMEDGDVTNIFIQEIANDKIVDDDDVVTISGDFTVGTTAQNSVVGLKAAADGAYVFPAGTDIGTVNGADAAPEYASLYMFFKFNLTETSDVVLTIVSDTGKYYQETANGVTAGDHYFNICVAPATCNAAADLYTTSSGSTTINTTFVYNQDWPDGSYTYNVKVGGTTLISGTFEIA